MRKLCVLTTTLFFSFFSANGQKAVYPFKSILKNIDTVIFRGSPTNNRSNKLDTFYIDDILKLRQLSFNNKKVQIENYGVTPQGSISFFKDKKRIILIGCWSINETEYGINISLNEKFTYYGLTISKKTFDKIFRN